MLEHYNRVVKNTIKEVRHANEEMASGKKSDDPEYTDMKQ